MIPLTTLVDMTGREGIFVLPTGALVSSATAAVPLGVITEGFPVERKSAVALANFSGTVKVKLGAAPGPVAVGTYLCLQADGTTRLDSGAGPRIRVARALEAGVAQELVEATLCEPVILV